MRKGYVLYNPHAGDGNCAENAEILDVLFQEELLYFDICRITNFNAFLRDIPKESFLIVAGGDGTLNHFINDIVNVKLEQKVLYFPTGTGNDFASDMGVCAYAQPFDITDCLKQLPVVRVNDKDYCFINGVGYGIDGYCCQQAERMRKNGKQKINYTSIAIGGLLGKYRPTTAHISVDGQQYTYQKVWIAPTMLGRYYGGGMMPAPNQNRLNTDGTVSLVVFHGTGPMKTLCIFPSLFKGTHIKHKKYVAVHTGHQITVQFDRPTPLQIDGELIENVTEYTVRTQKKS